MGGAWATCWRLCCLIPQSLSSPLIAWEAAYLRHWREEVCEIVLGGGLANGRLGQVLLTEMRNVLKQCGLGQHRLRLAEQPAYLPLIGAACSIPPGDWQAAAVADFGSTRAKRGLAWYAPDGALQRLQVLPTVSIEAFTVQGQTEPLAEVMAESLAEMLQHAEYGILLAPQVVCSVAAYVQDGLPSILVGATWGYLPC